MKAVELGCDVPPIIAGITGGIGSGKSVVSRILRLKGFRVYDCDTEARRLMECNRNVIDDILRILGDAAYSRDENDGSIRILNRGYVASKIFKDSHLRDEVNAVVHKAVAEDFLLYAKDSGGMVFCETAILATSHMDSLCDSIWVVTAPEDERIERVKKRNGLSEEDIKLRMATQREELESLPQGKIIEIRNGNSDMLLPQIDKLMSDGQVSEYEFLSLNGNI